MIEALFRAVVHAIVHVVGFYTAKVLLPIISFGMIRADEDGCN